MFACHRSARQWKSVSTSILPWFQARKICKVTCPQKWFARKNHNGWSLVGSLESVMKYEQQWNHRNDKLLTRPLPKDPSHQGCDSEQGGSLWYIPNDTERANKSWNFLPFMSTMPWHLQCKLWSFQQCHAYILFLVLQSLNLKIPKMLDGRCNWLH